MESLTEQSRAVDRCRALVAGYHRDIDSGRATAGIHAFTDDAEFEAHGRIHRGRAEILEFLRSREADTARQTVHVLANELATGPDVPNGEIELRAMVLLHVRQPDGTYALDRVLDTVHRLRCIDGEWLVGHRSSRPLHPTP